MILGRVCGTVVCTVQLPFYEGRKQLIVRKVKPDGSWDGTDYRVAVDIVDAGLGDLVLMIDEGNSARQLLDAAPLGPVRSVVVGVVDEVTHDEALETARAQEDDDTGVVGGGESP